VDGGFVAAGGRDDTTGYPNVDLYLLKGAWDTAGGGFPACPDFDGSQWVDVGDLTMAIGHWQRSAASPGWDPDFDLNADGVVDMVDLMAVARHWGAYCG
jgi:hypothetical protein